MARQQLPTVTLCAATSVNVPATIAALRRSAERIDFAQCLLFTDVRVADVPEGIRVVPIARLRSGNDYSAFMLKQLVDHIETPHCLVIQWDGFVLDAGCWDDAFLDFDYIGAPWPQFDDGHDVGNGGFSLRSRRLLEACRDPDFRAGHPEDIMIGRANRAWLESAHRIRFANRETAARFAFERAPLDAPAFGFHGVFNLARAMGVDAFWETYCKLDHLGTAFVDYWLLMRQLGGGSRPMRRRAKLTLDALANLVRR